MNLPPTVDLRHLFTKYGLEPRSQGNRGTCSIFALVGILEFEAASAGLGNERLSPEYLNWASHQINARTADGSFYSDALEGLQQFGICSEHLLPYFPPFNPLISPSLESHADAQKRRNYTAEWIKEWDVDTGLSDDQLSRICQSIAAEHPVAVGLRWPKQVSYHSDHLLAFPPPEEVFDGHSIVLVGYAEDANPENGGGTFVFRNSAGPEWGDHGYARFSFAYARAYANDAVIVHR